MFNRKKKIYISNSSGLGNRLETLVLANMIADHHGHAIYLDWPEKESLRIEGTQAGAIPPWDRLGSLKLRDFEEERLKTLGEARVIKLRACYGPRELQKRYALSTAVQLRPHPRIGQTIRDILKPYAGRPAVAVHIRQGDFSAAGDIYDATATRHPAAPLWWYEHVMEIYARRFPGVYFILGFNGSPETLRQLQQRFDIVTLPPIFDYQTLLPGHASAGHPVVDMFGLACCTTFIATPTSSYAHWTANLLGPEKNIALPPPRMARGQPEFGMTNQRGCVLLDWRDAAIQGRGMKFITDDKSIPPPTPPQTDWL